ncbi:MAG: YihY/virulence factor BrkB family protein [Ferruginibacter sp.]
MTYQIKLFFSSLKDAFHLFLKNDPLRMSGATAFFTLFALPPILIIIVQVFQLFIDPQTIRRELFENLSGMIGSETMRQVVNVIRAVRRLTYSGWATAALFIFLLFVATTLFRVIKSSINQLWGIAAAAPGKKVMAGVRTRIKSLAVILLTGLLFTIGILSETIQVLAGKYFFQLFPSLSSFFNGLFSFVVSTLITALWFLFIFRYLADGKPAWRIAWSGALLTAVLFAAGKNILHALLNYSSINTIYGASASAVLLLLFVFYSAMILYYGAAFTKCRADAVNCPIEPIML